MTIKRAYQIFFFGFLTWPIGHIAYTIADGLNDTKKSADAAVILGSKVNPDGTLSPRLTQRLNCGLQLYLAGRVKQLIVSGGLGKEGFWEGDKMKAFLITNGVPDTAITVDNYGNNTIATVDNTLKLRDSLHYKSLIIVSQYFHLTRTKMLFRKQHFDAVSSVSPAYFEIRDIYSLAREFIAYYNE